MANDICREYLKEYRKQVGAKKEEKIDKRYKSMFGWLAPNDKYYGCRACCGHCAEVEYLEDIYGTDEV